MTFGQFVYDIDLEDLAAIPSAVTASRQFSTNSSLCGIFQLLI